MVYVWNGDEWMEPQSCPFVALTTPVSFFHRIRSAAEWKDVRWVTFDEIHGQGGLMVFLFAFFVSLLCAKDPRVRDMGILLMTATKEGPVVAAVEKVLMDAGIDAGGGRSASSPGP